MFGYVNIDKTKLQDGQAGLWQTFMCGLCLSTKKLFGNIPRMFVTNDITFFNVLFHSVLQIDVDIQQVRCVSHPFKKRPVQNPTSLTEKIAVGNVILNYLNIYDDVVDGGGINKKNALKMYKKAYKKAQSIWPELDTAICQRYQQLRDLENSRCDSLDQVAHSFAMLSQDFCKFILEGVAAQDGTQTDEPNAAPDAQTSEYIQTLCYNLGKWIYLIDALDDLSKDLKKHNYNPFVACYGAQKVEDIAQHNEEITFLMYAVLNRIAQTFNDAELSKYNCILKNVLFDSIRSKTQQVLAKLK